MKILGILTALKHWLSNGGAGNTVGNAVANGASTVAVIAALAPAVIWIVNHKDDIFLTLHITYGWFSVICLGALFLLKVVHWTRPGRAGDRGQEGG